MKLKCIEWTVMQDKLPETAEGEALYQKIEKRTWGKEYQSSVAIALSKAEQDLVDTAMAECRNEGKLK